MSASNSLAAQLMLVLAIDAQTDRPNLLMTWGDNVDGFKTTFKDFTHL